MYGTDTDLLFPSRLVPVLKDLRSPVWQELVEEIEGLPVDSTNYLAFILMMVRLCGCMTCNIDSYRAMLGCGDCAHQALNRFRGSDAELIKKYKSAQKFILTRSGTMSEAKIRQ